MIHRYLLLSGLIALSAAACPALADVYSVTYTGTASGIDTNGVFGTAGATLNSVAFTSTYTYDPTQFGTATQYDQSGAIYVLGGSSRGTTDPILTAFITINGESYTSSSTYVAEQYFSSSSGLVQSFVASSASNHFYNGCTSVSSLTLSFTASQSFSCADDGYHFLYNGEDIDLKSSGVTITDSSPTAIPEPASFGLLACAAGVLVAARGKRRGMPRRQFALRGRRHAGS